MSKLLIMLGGGGHASVLCDILLSQGYKIDAIVSPEPVDHRTVFTGIARFESDNCVFKYSTKDVVLVNGIGPQLKNKLRQKIAEKFRSKGYEFATIVSDYAVVSTNSKLEEGVQVLHGAVVQAGVAVGEQSVVNTRAIIEHDCLLGRFNHIGPGAVLCGEVETGEAVYVGAGAIVTQCVRLEGRVIVGAGATVTRSTQSDSIVYPAKCVCKKVDHGR